MEVTHREDKVTHAVITAHRAMGVQLSNDASFLHTLTATLYSDQKGAVVREILCNAWDAHKAAERTHIPVAVTLTRDSMTFKDSGLGIPPGMQMLEIYGTYGASTKRNDGKQTGGFGLGSKAPWAYSDQFTVISCHKGTKTIYNMSKSSAEVDGKPSIIPITSMPTEEEGVTVIVPIKSNDYSTFTALIEKFAMYGDMNATLNGTKLRTLPFNSVQETYVVSNKVSGIGFSDRILVRYGDVLYPLGSKHELFSDVYNTALQILQKLGNDWRLILLAEPNTISVTPSRESLSMQTHTATTVKRLLENFIYKLAKSPEAKAMTNKILLEGLKKVNTVKKIPGLLALNKKVPGVENIDQIVLDQKIIHDPEVLTKVLLSRAYPPEGNFRQLDLETRLGYLIEQGIGNPGLIKTFMKLWGESKQPYVDIDSQIQEWFQRRIVGQVRRKIIKSTTMKESRLFVVGHCPRHTLNDIVTSATQARTLPLEDYIPYLRNIVVLSYTKNDAFDRLLEQKEVIAKYGVLAKFVLYTVPRGTKAVNEARTLFKSLNAVFVDLTKDIDIKIERIKRDPTTPKPAKKQPGLPLLSEAFSHVSFPKLNMSRLLEKTVKRTTTPEFYLHRPIREIKEDTRNLTSYGWMRAIGQELVFLFGSKGVLATTYPQVVKLDKQGIPHLETYLIEKTITEIKTNPVYAVYAANDIEILENKIDGELYKDLRSMLHYASIKKEFGIYVELTSEQKAYLSIAKKLLDYFGKDERDLQPVHDILCNARPSKAMTKLVESAKKSSMLHYVNLSEVALIIDGKDQQKALVALSLLKYALKG